MIKYSLRAQRIQSRILEMSQLSADHVGKNDSGKAFFVNSSNKLAQWMNETGLEDTRLIPPTLEAKRLRVNLTISFWIKKMEKERL